MTDWSRKGPLAAVAALLTCATLLSAPVSAGSLGAPVPEPRLAWLGSRSPSFERSTSDKSYAHPMPSLWGGIYAGVSGGYAWSGVDPIQSYDSVDLSSGYFGGYLGMNGQFQMLVLGFEADLGSRWGEGQRSFAGGTSLRAEAGLLSSLRLRAGFAFDNLLVYATGGLAVGSFEGELATATSLSRSSEMFAGYVWGGGLEMKLTENLSGRVEALHYAFDDKTFDFSSGPLRSDFSTTTVRAGLTYRFGR